MSNKQEEVEHIEVTDYWADVKKDTNINKEEDIITKDTNEKNIDVNNTKFNQDDKNKENMKEGKLKG